MKPLLPALACCALLAGCGASATATPTSHASRSARPTAAARPEQLQASIDTDHGPATLVIGKHAVFVAAHRGGTIQRVDPSTNRITGTVAVGGQLQLEDSTTSGGLASIDEDTTPLWTCTNTDGALNQVDAHAMRVTAMVPAHCDGGSRTRIGTTLWAVPGPDTDELLILDLKTGKVLHHEPIGTGGEWGAAVPAGGRVLVGAGAATPSLSLAGKQLGLLAVATPWITSTGGRLYRLPQDGTIDELDPATLATRRTFHVPVHTNDGGQLVADDSGHLYYRSDVTHVFRIDVATGNVTPFATLPIGEVPTAMAWGFGSLWVTNFDADTLWRLDTSVS
jgi:DNA-binding beta-propeller fold protein YncE